jgi:hypothetical protein
MFRCPCGGLFLPEHFGARPDLEDNVDDQSDGTPTVWACPRCARAQIFEESFSMDDAMNWFVFRSTQAVN